MKPKGLWTNFQANISITTHHIVMELHILACVVEIDKWFLWYDQRIRRYTYIPETYSPQSIWFHCRDESSLLYNSHMILIGYDLTCQTATRGQEFICPACASCIASRTSTPIHLVLVASRAKSKSGCSGCSAAQWCQKAPLASYFDEAYLTSASKDIDSREREDLSLSPSLCSYSLYCCSYSS